MQATTVMAAAAPTNSHGTSNGIGKPHMRRVIVVVFQARCSPSANPRPLPSNPSTSASPTTMRSTCPRVAPIARMIAICRVRLATFAVIRFATPMAATSSATTGTAESRYVMRVSSLSIWSFNSRAVP